jgi:hypothetical protein
VGWRLPRSLNKVNPYIICHKIFFFLVFSFSFFMCNSGFTLFCTTYPYFKSWIWETRTSVTHCLLQSTMFIISIKLLLINALYLKPHIAINVNISICTNPHSIWHKWMNFIQYVIRISIHFVFQIDRWHLLGILL